MKIFKDYTYSWKQIGIFKLALLSIGIIIGVIFTEFFTSNFTPLVIVAVITTLYVSYISLKQ